jgi:soluble cytochrome b562
VKKFPASWEGCFELQKGEKSRSKGAFSSEREMKTFAEGIDLVSLDVIISLFLVPRSGRF